MPGVKRTGNENDQVKNEWGNTSTPPIRLYGAVLN